QPTVSQTGATRILPPTALPFSPDFNRNWNLRCLPNDPGPDPGEQQLPPDRTRNHRRHSLAATFPPVVSHPVAENILTKKISGPGGPDVDDPGLRGLDRSQSPRRNALGCPFQQRTSLLWDPHCGDDYADSLRQRLGNRVS